MSDEVGAALAEARPKEGLTLGDISREIRGGARITGDANVRVFGVHHDSRRIEPGDMFVVRRGGTYDGSAFVAKAIERGAVAILADASATPAGVPAHMPVLSVTDVADGLAFAAAAVYGHPAFSLDIVGLTGTNGKTTTTHLVRAAIDGAVGKETCGIVGTIGHSFAGRTIEALHTTPEADELARILAVMKKRGATSAAMEVSSIALVTGRVRAVRFRVAAFTNFTQDHLDFHGTMEAYAAAKMSLFVEMAPGLAVVNVDDALGERIANAARCQVLRVRTRVGAGSGDIVPERIEADPSGMRVTVRIGERKLEIATRLVGLHNVENLLVALGVVHALELDLGRAAQALASELGAPGRLERCDGPEDDIVVLVDYAHTPDALARVLDAVIAVRGKGRVICVFGCGGDRDPTKREPMGDAVGRRADLAVVTSDNPRSEDPAAIAAPVTRAARAANHAHVEVELDRKRAIAKAVTEAAPGDIVLLAGKGHEPYQIVGTEKRALDDRVEARAALASRRGRQT